MSDPRRYLRVALTVVAIAATAALTVWPSAAALECDGIALDDGCLFTITGGDTADPDDGYAVTNADGVPLWDFVRERDLQAIGYPISQRWVNGPFTFQAFQKIILQWDPGKQRMNYYNTLDVVANRYPEVELPNVPAHLVLEADQGMDFATIKQTHLLLLDQNPTIKERFLSEPDWLNLYGLPIRYEEREAGGHPRGLQMLRAQRTVFVIWKRAGAGDDGGPGEPAECAGQGEAAEQRDHSGCGQDPSHQRRGGRAPGVHPTHAYAGSHAGPRIYASSHSCAHAGASPRAASRVAASMAGADRLLPRHRRAKLDEQHQLAKRRAAQRMARRRNYWRPDYEAVAY